MLRTTHAPFSARRRRCRRTLHRHRIGIRRPRWLVVIIVLMPHKRGDVLHRQIDDDHSARIAPFEVSAALHSVGGSVGILRHTPARARPRPRV